MEGPTNVQPGSGQVAQDTETAARSATTGPTRAAETGGVSLPAGRPAFTSTDGRFSAAVGAQIHYDVGGYIRGERDSPDRRGVPIRIGVDQSRTGVAPRPDLSFEGGYAEASWVMTGEHRAYTSPGGAFGGVRPRQPFSLREGHWGAFELVGRYSIADLNDRVTRGRPASASGGVFGGRQEIIGAGLNWYPSNNLRFMLQWNNVSVDRLNAAGTQQIGQRFDTVALRAQAAF